MAKSTLTEKERYWQKVDHLGPDECWEWVAYRNALGYGCFGRQGMSILAHRLAWELVNGPIPGDLCVLHHCDNPPCQNPAHLFLGTRVDNAADRNRKGRQARGERSGASRLTKADIRAIHRRYSEGISVPKLAREFDVHKSTIDAMVNGRSWIHLGLDWETRPGRLNPERVRAIRKRYAAGEGQSAIAADYRIGPNYISEVVARRVWASVV